jgi:catechol 2,3-dioxygenase-like lactoylglutathione lyase family enzyme
VSTSTGIAGIRAVSIPVDDQDAALAYYTDILGFTKLIDVPTPNGGRFLQLAPGTEAATVTLEPATPTTERGAILIRFATEDATAAHRALTAAGVDTDDILNWPGVPPMFSFRDLDGNTFSVSE